MRGEKEREILLERERERPIIVTSQSERRERKRDTIRERERDDIHVFGTFKSRYFGNVALDDDVAVPTLNFQPVFFLKNTVFQSSTRQMLQRTI